MNTTSVDTTIGTLFLFVLHVINDYFVPLIFGLAFIYFLWGAFRFFIVGKGSEESVEEGKKFLIWSIIGFVVMISVWGIVNLVIGSLPFNNDAQPKIPTFQTNDSVNTTNTTSPAPGNTTTHLYGEYTSDGDCTAPGFKCQAGDSCNTSTKTCQVDASPDLQPFHPAH